ncbi:MAG: PP2C family protein-serine/threonine phosphatase [Gammaproteobacteria bacterium]
MPNQNAKISMLGDRTENQDRVQILESPKATLLIAIDGMGGHSGGAAAAALAVDNIRESFEANSHPIFDPQGFLHLAIGKAHAAIVNMGKDLPVESRPRATCALCLIQDGAAYWGHIGDSRVYHLRGAVIYDRTRDHSHVELLLYEGAIKAEDIASHPMRNYVECCLGGYAELPRMSISNQKHPEAGDVMLVCSDGFWSPLEETELVELGKSNGVLTETLNKLGETAIRNASPYSDNTSAAAYSFAKTK